MFIDLLFFIIYCLIILFDIGIKIIGIVYLWKINPLRHQCHIFVIYIFVFFVLHFLLDRILNNKERLPKFISNDTTPKLIAYCIIYLAIYCTPYVNTLMCIDCIFILVRCINYVLKLDKYFSISNLSSMAIKLYSKHKNISKINSMIINIVAIPFNIGIPSRVRLFFGNNKYTISFQNDVKGMVTDAGKNLIRSISSTPDIFPREFLDQTKIFLGGQKNKPGSHRMTLRDLKKRRDLKIKLNMDDDIDDL